MWSGKKDEEQDRCAGPAPEIERERCQILIGRKPANDRVPGPKKESQGQKSIAGVKVTRAVSLTRHGGVCHLIATSRLTRHRLAPPTTTTRYGFTDGSCRIIMSA